ncbi:RDD family protein [Janthinobacterium sp. RB2R34]|uniref:RDD family protein n=1 Tax=Janthinobacterium sp. RB2R34 TaxID=3424193 RepID=UPI003F203F2F
MDTPDYSKYSAEQLRQILGRIDADRFPERVTEIEARLAELAAAPDSAPAAEATPAVSKAQPTATAILGRRILAFIVDMILLGVSGAIAGALLHAQFAAMGPWGRLVGFVVTLLYFGLLQSHLRGGQSIGMHLLGVRVVTRTGEPLGLSAAFIRAGIFCLAYFLNGAVIDSGQAWVYTAMFMLVASLTIAIYYLLLFNRRTGQSLHDLAVGAYVVSAGPGKILPASKQIWRGHGAVIGAAVLCVCVGTTMFFKYSPLGDTLAGLLSLQQTIGKMHGVDRVGVSLQTVKSDDKETHRLILSAVVDAATPEPQVLARRIALAALEHYLDAASQDQLIVTLVSGYDIGIASSMRMNNYVYTPEEWRAQQAGAAGAP